MFVKYSTLEVLSAKMAGQGTPLMRTAHRAVFDYNPRPGFLYVRSRAISSRTNDNFDTFPAVEIEAGFRTFIGKPVFVNHHNENHRRARGVIVDAVLHKDSNHDGSPDTWVEVLMEVDAVNFPKLAEAIVRGEIERTSMGTDVEYSLCSFCGNKAATPMEYCKHIPKLKGRRIRRTTASGATEDVLVSEICYGLKFFENSLLVEEPADPTAYFLGVDTRGLQSTSAVDSDANQKESSVLRNQSSISGTVDGRQGEFRPVRRPVSSFGGMSVHGSRRNLQQRGLHRNDQTGARMSFGGKRVTAALHKTSSIPKCDFCNKDATHWVASLGHEDDEYPTSPNQYGVKSKQWRCEDHRAAGQIYHPSQVSGNVRQASRHVGYGEVIAPPQVDTLAPTNCPICGTEEGFNGDECAVCGYLKPPDLFMDPDLEMAQQTDLRQDQKDQNLAGDMLAQTDPNALLECDLCGHAVPDADGVTPSVDGGAPAPSPTGAPPTPQPPTAPAGADPNPPGTTPLNPAQDAAPGAPTTPPGAELSDAPQDPPNPTGAPPAPKPDEAKDDQKPPAGKELPKKAPSPSEDAGDDPAHNPNAVDAKPDSDPSKPDSQKGDDAADTKTDDKGNPFAKGDGPAPAKDGDDSKPGFGKTDDSADGGKPKKTNPDGSDPATLPAAHEGDPCPSCGTGKLTKADAAAFNDEADALQSGDETQKEVTDVAEHEDQEHYPGDDTSSDDSDEKDDDKKKKPSPTDTKSKEGVKSSITPEGVSSMAARPMMQVVQEQQAEIKKLTAQNQWLYRAVTTLATAAGLRVTADDANPANPIPSPGAEAPFSTLQQERDSGTKGDVAGIGGVPGATDVAADATDTVDSIGGVKADTPYNISEDVTKPTEGTDGHRPLDEVRTVPEIQFGDALKPDAAFPLQGEFAGRATVGSAARGFAALRLARLRISAGIETGDDVVVAQRIESDASLSDQTLAYEADVLSKTLTAQAKRTPAGQPGRRVAAARAVPSVAASAPAPSLGSTTGAAVGSDEFAFE